MCKLFHARSLAKMFLSIGVLSPLATLDKKFPLVTSTIDGMES
jgi:hypothetical protein